MSNLSMIFSAVLMLALMAFIAPRILALNHGKILRNIALWLAIFAGLGLFYQYFGPFHAGGPIRAVPRISIPVGKP